MARLKELNPIVAFFLHKLINLFDWFNWILKGFLSSVLYGLDFLGQYFGDEVNYFRRNCSVSQLCVAIFFRY